MITKSEFTKIAVVGRKQIEKIIDGALRSSAREGPRGALTIAVSLFGCDEAALGEVLADYRRHGWKCTRVSDPRDGDYIEFLLDD